MIVDGCCSVDDTMDDGWSEERSRRLSYSRENGTDHYGSKEMNTIKLPKDMMPSANLGRSASGGGGSGSSGKVMGHEEMPRDPIGYGGVGGVPVRKELDEIEL